MCYSVAAEADVCRWQHWYGIAGEFALFLLLPSCSMHHCFLIFYCRLLFLCAFQLHFESVSQLVMNVVTHYYDDVAS